MLPKPGSPLRNGGVNTLLALFISALSCWGSATFLALSCAAPYSPDRIWEVRHVMTTVSILPPDYRPSDDEPFMNELQREYFRQKLLKWRSELLRESEETLEHLQEGGLQEPDLADRASAEMERALELRTRDRARKLISKIDAALERLEHGTYGYCEETGEPISLRRLEARPIATLSIEAQERHERMERTHRTD